MEQFALRFRDAELAEKFAQARALGSVPQYIIVIIV